MNPIIKNILAVIAGWLGGSIINMGLIKVGHMLFPPGVDPNDMDAYAAIMPTLGPKHFLFPLLAHALGTLVGSTIAGLIAANHKMKLAMGIGGLFFLGGIMVNYMLSGPIWFTITDIVLAYLPMAWIGGTFAVRKSGINN